MGNQILSFLAGEPRDIEALGKNMTFAAVCANKYSGLRRRKIGPLPRLILAPWLILTPPLHISQLNISPPERYNLGNLRVRVLLSPQTTW